MKIALLLTSLLISISAHAERGGITAGGGDISVPDPIDQYRLQKAIEEAKFPITQWANFEEHQWMSEDKPEGRRTPFSVFLFERSDSVFEYIKNTKIQLENNGSCKDGSGRETDGSAHGLPKDTICISTQRLGNKLSQLNFEYEVSGLIMHEIAHLMGANEAMAIVIQKDVIQALNGRSSFRIALSTNSRSTKLANLALAYSDKVKHIESYRELDELRVELAVDDSDHAQNGSLNPLRNQAETIHEDLSAKVAIVQEFLASLDPSVDPQSRKTFADRYAKAFGSNDEIYVRNYLLTPSPGSVPVSLKIRKMATYQDVERELQDVLNHAAGLAKEMNKTIGLRFENYPN